MDSSHSKFTLKSSSKKTIAEKDRVSLKQKIAYAAGGLAEGIQDKFDNAVMAPIFVIGAGVSPAFMSVCGGVYRFYDAMTDLAVGHLSDNTRTRWGRRRPYVFVGAILMGLSMPILFQFNPEWSTFSIGAWMIAFNLLILTTQTIYNVPYQCLLIESTADSNERTNVASWRAFVGMAIGIIVSWSWWLSQRPIFHVDGEPDPLNGMKWLLIIVAIPVILLGMLPAIFMKERFYHEVKKQKKVSVKENLKATISNKPFKLLLAFILVFVGGTGLHWGLVFYVKLFYVCQGDQVLASELSGIKGTAQAFMGVTGIPVARQLAFIIGKKKAVIIGLCFALVAYLSTYFLMTPKSPYLSVIPFVMMGPAHSIIWVILPSMLGDVVDHDELTSYKRLEGAYSAVFSWMNKVSRTIPSILSGFLVVWAGYKASERATLAQNFEVLNNMRILLMILPTFFIAVAAIILWFYPLNAETIKETRAELERRRGEV